MPLPPRRVVQAVLGLRRMLQRAADLVVPPGVAVFEHSIGFGLTGLLGVIARLRIADRLATGPRTAEQLAAELGTDADALHRTLRAAAAAGFVGMRRDGTFVSNRMTRALESGRPGSMQPWCEYASSQSNLQAWTDFEAMVRSGRNAFRRIHGMSVWEWFEAHPQEGRTFAEAMRILTEIDAPAIVSAYAFPETGTVCDVAGGAGTLLGRVLLARPGLRGVLVEAPAVLQEADRHLRSLGVRERVELVEGDIFHGFAARADVYTLKNVLHDWDDATAASILANIRASMPDGARIAVIEAVIERNGTDAAVALSDVHMMTVCEEGRERSACELQKLLAGAGFALGGVTPCATGVHVVEGTA